MNSDMIVCRIIRRISYIKIDALNVPIKAAKAESFNPKNPKNVFLAQRDGDPRKKKKKKKMYDIYLYHVCSAHENTDTCGLLVLCRFGV